MDPSIECPICEEQFPYDDSNPEAIVECPSCDRKFLASSATILNDASRPREAMQTPQPKQKIPTAELKLSRLDDDVSQDRPQSDTPPSQSMKEKTGTKAILLRAKKRKNQRYLMLSSVLFAIVAGVLGGFLFVELSKQNQEKLSQADPERLETPTEGLSKDLAKNSDASLDSDDPAPGTVLSGGDSAIEKPLPKFAELPKRRTRYFDQKQLNQCWEKVRPYLVSLKIHKAQGISEAVGVIVDSRGWVLTSYSKILGATRIEVTSAARRIENISDNLLSDDVRGIVPSASDLDSDIAIISVNPRFVVNFGDLPISNFRLIVPGAFLVKAGPPSRKNLYGRSEAAVVHRDRIGLLPTADQVKDRNFNSSKLEWLVAKSKTEPVPGTPLFTIDGSLVAFEVFGTKQNSHYVMVRDLKRLLSNASGEIDSLLKLGGATIENGTVEVATSHPMAQKIDQLDQLGATCSRFDWLPKNKQEFEQFQLFIENLDGLQQFANSDQPDEEELRKPVVEHVSRWGNTLSQQFSRFSRLADERTQAFFRLAEQELEESDRYLPIVGKVVKSAFELNGNVLLKFPDEEAYVLLSGSSDENSPPLFPGKTYLVFVKTPADQTRVNKSIGGVLYSAYLAEQVFVRDLIE